jgi:glucose/arabinose dehydrogenase
MGRWRAAGAVVALIAAAAAVTACAPSRPRADPTWVPQQSARPIPMPTPVPDTGGGGGSDSATPSPSQSSGSSTQRLRDAAVVATKLNAPTGVAVLPDGSALVAERTTGRILQVQPVPNKPVRLIRRLTGLTTSGGGGLLDIALSPSYTENRLILALITTKRDTRVVHFTANGPVTPILTGIPRGTTDNVGRLMVLGDGSVLVGTGDAGMAANAPKLSSLGGKVLRMDELGRPVSGNPHPNSVVYTSGHRTVNGLCFDDAHSVIYETEDGSTGELNRIVPGTDYGWPAGDGQGPVADIPDTPGLGSCAVLKDSIYVGSLGGKALLRARIDPTTGTVSAFTPMIAGQYGRLLTVVGANDGSLWITTSNKDGHGKPVADDERVLHITPDGGGGGNSPE